MFLELLELKTPYRTVFPDSSRAFGWKWECVQSEFSESIGNN